MAGYLLVEERMLKPNHPNGLEANPNRMGFLDYLRELRDEHFPFSMGHGLRLVGLDELLVEAIDDLPEVCAGIRRTLNSRANELEQIGGHVQVVFRYHLHQADDFYFDVGMRRVSLRSIFGSVQHEHQNGVHYYLTGYNLT